MVYLKNGFRFLLCLIVHQAFGQDQSGKELWGVLFRDVAYDSHGTIFKTDFNGENMETVHAFEATGAEGSYPNGSLTQYGDKLYGVTSSGGENDNGVLFEYDLETETFTVKKHFGAPGPEYMYGSLLLASDSLLYGISSGGGENDFGTVFNYDPRSDELTVIHDFNNTNGSLSLGNGFIEPVEGTLYAMTYGGGATKDGTIQKVNLATQEVTLVHSFNEDEMAGSPYGDLTLAPNGKLYGILFHGGDDGVGGIFEFDMETGEITYKHSFNSDRFFWTYGSFILAPDNNLYAIAGWGGANSHGAVWQYIPGADTAVAVADFNEANGSLAEASMMLTSDGRMLGLTQYGGSNSAGVLYEFDYENFEIRKLLDLPTLGNPRKTQMLEVNLPCTEPFTENISVTACNEYEFDGKILTESGSYEAAFLAKDGCDSLVTLNLDIVGPTNNEVDITTCGSYEFDGNTLTSSGEFSATFTSKEGCDSLVNLLLTILDPEGVDCPETITGLDDDPQADSITVYPNPTHGRFTVYLGKEYSHVTLETLSISGKLIKTEKFERTNLIKSKLNVPQGTYIIRISVEDANKFTQRITKK